MSRIDTILWVLLPYVALTSFAVHVWSVPVGYVVRSPIVYRAKRDASRTAFR